MILPLSRFTMTVAVSVALVVMLPYFAWLTYTLQLMEPDISGAVMSAARRSTTESSPTTSRMVTPLADGSLAEISYDDPNAQRLADATASQGGVPICECLHDWGPGATLMCDGTLLYTAHCVDEVSSTSGNSAPTFSNPDIPPELMVPQIEQRVEQHKTTPQEPQQ